MQFTPVERDSTWVKQPHYVFLRALNQQLMNIFFYILSCSMPFFLNLLSPPLCFYSLILHLDGSISPHSSWVKRLIQTPQVKRVCSFYHLGRTFFRVVTKNYCVIAQFGMGGINASSLPARKFVQKQKDLRIKNWRMYQVLGTGVWVNRRLWWGPLHTSRFHLFIH